MELRIGQFVTGATSAERRDCIGTGRSARRVREPHEGEAGTMLAHNDSAYLRVGQHSPKGMPPMDPDVKFARGVSLKLRTDFLDRNDFFCQMCGMEPGEIDPATLRKVRLHLGHIVDKSLGGKDELSNLRALCSSCNQGAKNITGEKPSGIWLLSQVRRAGQDEQRAVFDWLEKKFRS